MVWPDAFSFSTSSDGLSRPVWVDGCWRLLLWNFWSWLFIQTLMDGSCCYFSSTSLLRHYYHHGPFIMMTKAAKQTSALCFSSLIVVVGVRSRMILSEAACVWTHHQRNPAGKLWTRWWSRTDQTDGVDCWSYLAGNLERGGRPHASMWRCVRDGSRNAK